MLIKAEMIFCLTGSIFRICLVVILESISNLSNILKFLLKELFS